MYDITDVDSFARVKNWVKELRKIVGDDIAICIAGNKMDLQKNAHVSVEEADAYAASVGAQHIRTSAKLNQGVNDVFMALVQSERCPPSTGPACASCEPRRRCGCRGGGEEAGRRCEGWGAEASQEEKPAACGGGAGRGRGTATAATARWRLLLGSHSVNTDT